MIKQVMMNVINMSDPTEKVTMNCAPSSSEMVTMAKYTIQYMIAIVSIIIRKGVMR